MKSKRQVLFPKYQKILEQAGENIKLARKRRSLTTIQVAERAGITGQHFMKLKKEIRVCRPEVILVVARIFNLTNNNINRFETTFDVSFCT